MFSQSSLPLSTLPSHLADLESEGEVEILTDSEEDGRRQVVSTTVPLSPGRVDIVRGRNRSPQESSSSPSTFEKVQQVIVKGGQAISDVVSAAVNFFGVSSSASYEQPEEEDDDDMSDGRFKFFKTKNNGEERERPSFNLSSVLPKPKGNPNRIQFLIPPLGKDLRMKVSKNPKLTDPQGSIVVEGPSLLSKSLNSNGTPQKCPNCNQNLDKNFGMIRCVSCNKYIYEPVIRRYKQSLTTPPTSNHLHLEESICLKLLVSFQLPQSHDFRKSLRQRLLDIIPMKLMELRIPNQQLSLTWMTTTIQVSYLRSKRYTIRGT